jgi:hypothetical protein
MRKTIFLIRLLLLCLGFLSGCERQPTRAELEHEVLRTTFRYFCDHELSTQAGTVPSVVFVGTPGEFDEAHRRPLIETIYRDPSPEWQSALASAGMATRPASEATYDPANVPNLEPPFYRDLRTGERALVFSIHSITFPTPDSATAVSSAAVSPTSGGERTYQLVRVGRTWRVTDSRITAVY